MLQEPRVDHSCHGNSELFFFLKEGRTPLQYASLRGKVKVVEVLLLSGADVSIVNKVQTMPRHTSMDACLRMRAGFVTSSLNYKQVSTQ
jgi:ankyrin repeat protein